MAATYQIAELKPGERGGYSPRGGAKKVWQCRNAELMLSGPADTGKTFACCQKLDALMWRFPGAQAAIVRKVASSMVGSVLQTYAKVMGPKTPVVIYGGNRPVWYDYPNGSRVYVGGMDDPGKVLSSERDVIYVNQAEELELNDWETLLSRASGRAGNMPYAQMLGDCNPGPPTHWIKHRDSLTFFESRHEDNPTIYDDDGNLTPGGAKRLAILDSLTGLRYKRLRLGLWVSAEGMVYEGYDPAIHLIDRNDARYGLQNGVPDAWPRYWVVDFGYTNPFVWLELAEDPDGRLFLVREIYLTKRLVEDHARRILEVTKDSPRPVAIICDHDAEDRATLQKHLGMATVAAHKTVSDGIQAVQVRLRPAGDGKPRLLLLRDSLDERDEDLHSLRKPTCTAEEFEVYVWDTRTGVRKGEQVVKEYDHGMDDLRYGVAYRDLRGGPATIERAPKAQRRHTGMV